MEAEARPHVRGSNRASQLLVDIEVPPILVFDLSATVLAPDPSGTLIFEHAITLVDADAAFLARVSDEYFSPLELFHKIRLRVR
jgi:hypothetical protein